MTTTEKLIIAEAEIKKLQAIIDSRPAINVGLPETYIKWSQNIYLIEYLNSKKNEVN